MALGQLTWALAYVHGLKHAYAGTFLCTQLGFQKHEKEIFFAIMAKVWDESCIVWESFQALFFFHYKRLYMVYFQKT